MIFTMEVGMDNAAFAEEPAGELIRILRRVEKEVSAGSEGGRVLDVNGNTCGWDAVGEGKY